ncbi:MAG: 4Fe-4S binding protein [Candidatus Jordarchaeales archaeon]
MADAKKVIAVDRKVCWGCGNCIEACPFNPGNRRVPLIWMKHAPILRLVNGACSVVSDACSELLPDCKACERICPTGALKILITPMDTLK